jgi:hypothetical protein
MSNKAQIKSLLKFVDELHQQEQAMQDTIADDAGQPGGSEHSCYRTHEENKRDLEMVRRELERNLAMSNLLANLHKHSTKVRGQDTHIVELDSEELAYMSDLAS